MRPHPEGGWYVETWRAPAVASERPVASAILFLLAAGEHSHWHRVDAAEIWQWSGGGALALRIARSDAGPGRDVAAGWRRAGRRQAAGLGAARRVAGGTAARRVDARRLHRRAGVQVRRLRAGSGGLGPRALTASRRDGRGTADEPPCTACTEIAVCLVRAGSAPNLAIPMHGPHEPHPNEPNGRRATPQTTESLHVVHAVNRGATRDVRQRVRGTATGSDPCSSGSGPCTWRR